MLTVDVVGCALWSVFSTRRGEREGEGRFFDCPTFWALAFRHVRVNSRRFLAVQCSVAGMCRVVSQVPCASTRLSSKIVCSTDEKVA